MHISESAQNLAGMMDNPPSKYSAVPKYLSKDMPPLTELMQHDT
jgi:hypothetical protein